MGGAHDDDRGAHDVIVSTILRMTNAHGEWICGARFVGEYVVDRKAGF